MDAPSKLHLNQKIFYAVPPLAHLSTKRSQEGIMKAFVATGGPL